MSNKNPTHSFPKGNTIAKESGNPKRKRIRKSKLRKTLEKLLDLEPQALSNISKSVNGEEIDKSVVDSSKWVISNIMHVTKAAAADEADLNELRWKGDKIQEEMEEAEEEEITPKSRFSLVVLPSKEDLDK